MSSRIQKEMSEFQILRKAPRIGIDFHVIDGIFQGSRSHVLELFSEVIRCSTDIHFVLFLENTYLLRSVSYVETTFGRKIW